jgi:hypothetical protein
MTPGGSVYFNQRLASSRNLSCWYSLFRRGEWDEQMNVYGEAKRLTNSSFVIKLSAKDNMMNVTCFDRSNKTVYINTHMLIPRFGTKESSSPTKPNILILFVESLSNLAFKRSMKKTASRMKKNGAIVMENFIRSGENSFPNMIAFLTGQVFHNMSHQKAVKSRFLDQEFRYLWQDFRDHGYITGYMKDLPHIGDMGFHKPPTDFYPHAYWLQMYPDNATWRNEYHINHNIDFCFDKNGPKVKLFLDQITEFVKKNRQHPYFLMANHVQMTHQHIQNFAHIDPFYESFMKDIKSLGENTIIILAGDHGPRRSAYAPTSIGRLEGRHTLLSFLIHKSIDKKFPHLKRSLKLNQKTLMSWFDIHLMMKKIADGSFTDPTAIRGNGSKFYNPMTHIIPLSRTCADAGIPEVHCVCGNRVNTQIRRVNGNSNDFHSVTNVVNSLFMDRCNVVIGNMTSMHYDIPVNSTVLLEKVEACFSIPNKKDHVQSKCIKLRRDLRKQQQGFVIQRESAKDPQLCHH